MSDELERLARLAEDAGREHDAECTCADRYGPVPPYCMATMRANKTARDFANAATVPVILALLSERRELVAGLREALEIANWPASEGSARLRQGQRIAKLSALAARIAPNQDGEK